MDDGAFFIRSAKDSFSKAYRIVKRFLHKAQSIHKLIQTCNMSVTASDWAYGIGYSVLASIIGGASKLCIRKSWLMVQGDDAQEIEINDSTFRANHDDCNIETSESYESPAQIRIRRESSSSQDSDSVDDGDQERSPMSLINAEHRNEERERQTQAQNESSCTSTKKNRLAIFLRLSGMFGM